MAELRILSKRIIRPSPRADGGRPQVIHLTPCDLMLISVDYLQKGLLFRDPSLRQGEEGRAEILSKLHSSFSCTLDHFYPLAGRLAIVKHDSDDDTSPSPTMSIILECNDQGAEFIHASAPGVTVSEILDSVYIPSVVLSFFPLNGVINFGGHSLPLLAGQVTELADGIFVSCSMNHATADGTSFWRFFNSWSEICRTGDTRIADPPIFDRFFLHSCPVPIRLPFSSDTEFVKIFPPRQITECAFHFPADSMTKLKAKANEEMDTGRISALSSLLGHLWRSVTRARDLEPQQETTYKFLLGCQPPMDPPLQQTYLGNYWYVAEARAMAGELLEKGLSWSAWLLNQAIDSDAEKIMMRNMMEEWPKNPSFVYGHELKPWELITGTSPGSDIDGNDFGWGKPASIRSGRGNKGNGKVSVYPGEEGGMVLEVNLPPEVLNSLLLDMEFMDLISITVSLNK